MKYCDQCANEYGFPITSHMHDNHTCELCGKQSDCNQASISELEPSLSDLKRVVQAGREAQKLLDKFYDCAYNQDKK